MEDKRALPVDEDLQNKSVEIKQYSIDKPYPEVNLSEKDRIYLPIIFENYASRLSEYTAISQYIFSHFSIEGMKYKTDAIDETAKAFENIAIVEMVHLELLADVITGLSAAPEFVNSKKREWKSSFVPYGTSIKNHLELAVKAEQDAIKQYKHSMKLINNESINALIARIIEDEELHTTIFAKLLDKII